MKISYIDIKKEGLEFKNLIQSPAHIGLMLNYIMLTGAGRLKYKTAFREKSLKDDIGYSWTTEFMIGLQIVKPDNVDNVSRGEPVKLVLTERGERIYQLIKDSNVNFDDANDEKCREQVLNIGNGLYETLEDIFLTSIQCRNLCIYIFNNNDCKFSFDKSKFRDKYFGELLKYYTNQDYVTNSSTATTADNLMPSTLDLCKFFELLGESRDKFYFDFASLSQKCQEIKDYVKMNGENKKMNDLDIEREYKKWLLNIKEPRLQNDESADSYISSMKKVYNEFDKLKDYTNIFDITNSADAKEYYDYIISNNDFKTKYLDNKNYAAKSGFSSYIDFLEYINLDHNIIFFGVPGAGKSHKIDSYKRVFIQERTVFHPEYSYSDFVGQILPDKSGDDIKYEFKAGAFTRILIKALMNPTKNYMLVIEEINRGNAAAIFGEIFQLLDREFGNSKYYIDNKDIADAIKKHYPNYYVDYKKIIEGYKKDFDIEQDNIVFIPKNLYIWATMNTSDQNVFTLDTAFQRRWTMEMVTNNFENSGDAKAQGDIIIDGSNSLTWNEFAGTINALMTEKKIDMISTEDKRLGVFFASKKELTDKKRFVQKVIKYLWDDAFKLEKTDGLIFNIEKYKTLDSIVEDCEKDDFRIENIFVDGIFNSIAEEIQNN